MSGKPMDPKRLDDLREGLKWNEAETPGSAACPPVPADLVAELLDDRDHQEAKATKAERSRDDARRYVCETIAGMVSDLDKVPKGPMAVAAHHGWVGLYPEATPGGDK